MLITGFLQAQPTTCFDFESLELNSQFGKSQGQESGDTIRLVGNDVITTVQRFIYSTSVEPGFESVSVVNWDFGGFSDSTNQYLFISNINLDFDFSRQPDKVSMVSFDFVDGGGEENISVNGATAHLLQFLHEAPTEIAPGVTFEVQLDTTSNIPQGTIFLHGGIKQLAIGGQELGFDNLCIVVNDVPPLCFENLVAEAEPCTPNGIFYTQLKLEANNPPSDSFQIIGNGIDYGKFPYGQSSYRVGPTEANYDVIYWYEVRDISDPNCVNTAFVEPPCSDINCKISEVFAEAHPCRDDGSFLLDVVFKVQKPSSDSFFIRGNGHHYGTFAYGKTFYTVGPLKGNGETEYEFVIIDQKNPNCSNGMDFGRIDCSITDCKIVDLAAETSVCHDNSTFDLFFKFSHQNANSSGFDVLIDGDFYEFISFAAPVDGYKLTDLKLPAGEHKLTICGNDNPNCCLSVGFKAPKCKKDCNIFGLETEVHSCDIFGEFLVDVFFKVENPASDSFIIESNDGVLGTYAYGQDFYTVGPFVGNGTTLYYFAVVDQKDFGCGEKTQLAPVSCLNPDCFIEDLVVEVSDCNPNGSVNLTVKFDISAPIAVNMTYSVFIGDRLVGFYPITENPLLIENIQLDRGIYKLGLCLDINSVCCKRVEFKVPFCQGDCQVFDLQTELSDCRDDGTVDMKLDFKHENLSTERFEVILNGEKFDTFNISQLPIVLEGLKLPVGSNWVGVCINQPTLSNVADVCCTRIEFEVPKCNKDCRIYDLVAEATDCHNNGTFDLEFKFLHENANTAGFDVLIDGDFYDFIPFSAADGYKLTNLLLPPGGHKLTICGNDQPDCCQSIEFKAPSCGPFTGIKDLSVSVSDCRFNGSINLTIKFDIITDALPVQYKVLIDGELIGEFPITEIPLILENLFLKPGEHKLQVTLGDALETVLFEAPECSGDCRVFDIKTEVSGCFDDGTYALKLDFRYEFLTGETFEVLLNGEVYGPFKLAALPVVIDGLKMDPGENWVGVCVFQSTTPLTDDLFKCCVRKAFEVPKCDNVNDCKISKVFAEAHPCKDDGTFLVDIEFKVENPEAARFQIVGNGHNYGTYEYGKPFYTIGPIKGDGETAYEFIVQDLENPDCQDFTDLTPINCNPNNDCLMGDLRTDVSNCHPNGTVDIKVDFKFENANDKGFNVFIDEEYIETYSYQQLPIVLNGLQLPASEYKLSVCRNELPNCCLSREVIIPECGTCSITNVAVATFDCSNEDFFSVALKFEVENPSSDRFRVIGNSQLYGVFPYGQSVYKIGPLDGDGETLYEFIVQDLKNPTCASFAELETTIDCEEEFVWPGDANFDNITNNFDLLNIGLAFGKEGPQRVASDVATEGISWEAQKAENWEDEFITGLNYKHADCNGDGIINQEDIKAINENYFFTHGAVIENASTPGNENDPALFVDFPSLADIQSGQEIKAPIIFGNSNIPAEAYGLAFTLRFDPQLIMNAKIELTNSWLGAVNQNILSINQNFATDGIIEIALTKTDKTNSFGAGPIGNFIVIIDNIEGYTGQSSIEIQKVQAIDKEGNLLAIYTPKTMLLPPPNNEEELTDDEGGITVYPNPASDVLTLESELKSNIESIDIRSISGKKIQSVNINQSGINVSDLLDGIYIIEVKTTEKTYFKKFVKQR